MPIIYPYSTAHNHDNAYLGLTAKAADSDTVDGAHASATPTQDYVSIADGVDGRLANGWMPYELIINRISNTNPVTTYPGMVWVHPNG